LNIIETNIMIITLNHRYLVSLSKSIWSI